MKNMRKLLAVVLGVALIIGILATTSFAATTGTGVFGDPIVCDSVADIPATYTLEGGQELYIKAPIGGQAVTISDPNGWATIKNPMTGMSMGTTYDCSTAPEGLSIEFCIMNQNPRMAANITISVGAPALPDPGTEGNPLPVEFNSNFLGYLMNDALEAGDSDGIWYSIEAHKAGVLYVDVNCSADVSYGVDVYAGTYQGVSSEGNPIITYRVAQGEEIIIHKYADPDLYGNIPAVTINAFASIVDAAEGSEVPLKTTEVKVPVASGDEVSVIDNTREGSYSGRGLIVSGYADAIKVATVTVNGVGYTDVDGDGLIEITTPGSFSARPSIAIQNNHEYNIAFTVKAVESASESAHVHDTIHFDAVTPGCHSLGNIEYWFCAGCEGFWQDEALTQLTNSKNVILPATGSQNMVHFDAVTPGCHYNGNVEYWFCADCEGFWTDEACTQVTNSKNVVLPATGSPNVQHVAAVTPNCYEGGNIEYWHCPDCEGFWTDEACTQVTNSKNVLLGVNHEGLIHFEAVEPGCHSNGNIEYWFCPTCEGFWQDITLTQITNSKSVVLPATGSQNMVHFDAVTPGCHYNGNVEYWFCADCEGFWTDEACTQVTNSKNVVLPATGSPNVQHVAAVTPNCYEGGNIEYWHCPDCEGFWTDEACTQVTNSKNVLLGVNHEGLIHFEAVEPGCHSNGNIEYWFCPTCEGFWQDITLTQITNSKNVILPATGSENVIHFEALDPACHSLGNIEYWFCPDCEGFWTDEACTQVTNSKRVILPMLGSEDLKHVKAVAATCTENGNIEYWFCPDCEGYFQDEACTQVTNAKRVITPATGHTEAAAVKENVKAATTDAEGSYDEVVYCSVCKAELSRKTVTTPKLETPATGDATPVVALLTLSVMAVMGLALVVVGKKKYTV